MRCPWLLFLLLPAMLPACLAHFNLYLSSSEVATLLGMNAELWYVREGVVMENALAFEVPVPAGVAQLQFQWQALPGAGPLPYQLHVAGGAGGARASLDVPGAGVVPAHPAAWRVLLPCAAAHEHTHTLLHISLNVTLPAPAAPLELTLRRRKTCLKAAAAASLSVGGGAGGYVAPAQATRPAHILYAGAACLAAALLLGGGAAAACRSRSQPAHARARARPQRDPFLAAAGDSCRSGASYASCGSVAAAADGAAGGEGGAELQARLRELTVQRGAVRLRALVHEGTYGRVYRGTCACGRALPSAGLEHEHEHEHEVLVKTVSRGASGAQVSRLLREGCMLWGCEAARVLALHAVALADADGEGEGEGGEAEGEAPLLVYGPAPPHHNLKRWLQAGAGAGALSSPRQARLLLHAAEALAHLHRQRILHRDLAARNCLVDDHDNLQLADNGLSRDLFPGDYDCLGDNEIRPVRWLAPEVLAGGAGAGAASGAGVAGDVWALGVLGWEVGAGARLPYGEVDAGELGAALARGLRLARPPTCPPPLYAALASCWAAAPPRRPPPAHLAAYLAAFLRQLDSYV